MTPRAENRDQFINQIKIYLNPIVDYSYVRELRNAVVHRGLDISAAGHSDGFRLRALCPTFAQRQGKVVECKFQYQDDLAIHCVKAVDTAIENVLEEYALLDLESHETSEDDFYKSIDQSSIIPDWAKKASRSLTETKNFSSFSTELAAYNIQKMRSLLIGCQVSGNSFL